MNHWWMWIVLGVVLAAIELLTPGGLFIIFFGVSAVVVGMLALAGMDSAPLQWLLFSVVAVLALRFFRTPLLARLQKDGRPDTVDSLVGETAIAASNLAPGEHGRVELRGSMWNGHNVGSRTIEASARCRVVAVDGLRLDVLAS